MDQVTGVVSVLRRHRLVREVRLVGSRAAGTPTALSDWDFVIDADEPAALAVELPDLAGSLRPLAAQWDRLSHRRVFMLILVGGVKVDLFPGDLASDPLGPWIADGSNLARMDQHFWDWTIWLAGKQLAARHELVSAELEKLHANLLGPLGSDKPPSPVGCAVETYRARRRANEQAWGTRVDRLLGETISRRLRDNNVV